MEAYYFSLNFNDTYAFREYPPLTEYQRIHQELIPDMSGTSRRGVRRCVACGDLLAKWDEPLIGLKIKKRFYDVACTYDGVDVVSEKFKQAYESKDLQGLRFDRLPDDPTFFRIVAVNTVEFDAERRKTRFDNPCSSCGRYKSVVGATPVYLKQGSIIPDRGFVRTDLEFASADEKSPLLICGRTAGQILKDAKLKGLDLVEI